MHKKLNLFTINKQGDDRHFVNYYIIYYIYKIVKIIAGNIQVVMKISQCHHSKILLLMLALKGNYF